MCQCTAGNKIHTCFQDFGDIFLCDISGAFCLCPACDKLYCFFHHFRCHIVKHNDICSCFYCFFYLFHSLYFNLDLTDKWCIFFCHGHCFRYASGCSDMIILKQYSVRKIISVVASAAYTYSIFFKNTTVRSCLSGVQKCYLTSFQKL